MSIRRKLLIGSVGVLAFAGALIVVPIVSMVISGLLPGASKDAPGKMEPSMEETLKQMNSPQSTAKQNKEETKPEQPNKESESQQSQNETPSVERSEPQLPAPVASEQVGPAADPPVNPAPPRPVQGPGNFHVDQPYQSSGGIGPGNL